MKELFVVKVDARLFCGEERVVVVQIRESLRVRRALGVVPHAVNVLFGRVAVADE